MFDVRPDVCYTLSAYQGRIAGLRRLRRVSCHHSDNFIVADKAPVMMGSVPRDPGRRAGFHRCGGFVMPTKICGKCKRELEESQFGRDSHRKDGHQWRCKGCAQAAYAAYCASHQEQVRQKNAAWMARHRDERNRRRATLHANHREEEKQYTADYRVTHPDAAREYCAIRRARIAGAPVVETFARAEIFERDGGVCHVCHKKVDPNNWHLDHLVPLARGGEHSRVNVAIAHPKCNMRRSAYGPAQLRLLG